MAMIKPEPGTESDVAALLLAIVDAHPDAFHPRDVATDTDQGLAFVVPDGLCKLYEEAMAQEADDSGGEDKTDTGAPVRRGPGRPRKITTAPATFTAPQDQE